MPQSKAVNVSVLGTKFRPYRLGTQAQYRLSMAHVPKGHGKMLIVSGMYNSRIVLAPQGQKKGNEPGTPQGSDKRGE